MIERLLDVIDGVDDKRGNNQRRDADGLAASAAADVLGLRTNVIGHLLDGASERLTPMRDSQ